jgi:PelA/Pel-15E family pectate lyase
MKRLNVPTRTLILVAAGLGAALAQPHAQVGEPQLTWRQALRQSPEWHASPEALRIAEQILLYQYNNGGWGKNIDMARPLTNEQRQQVQRHKADLRQSTLDNDATFQQMDFLARVYRATGQARYRQGVERGLDFLIDAQYPNGGWPQFPARDSGYSTQITYNDGAMAHALNRLLDIVQQREPYDFFAENRRQAARAALDRGIECVIKTQIRVEGRLTAWCAQHDKETLKPAQGRSYEHPSISGAESVGVVRFLMRLDNPSPEIIHAIQSAVEWFELSRLRGIRLRTVTGPEYPDGRDRIVVKDPDAPALWARFYDIETNRPIFSGRDGVIRYHLADIEHERRNGYSWLGPYATALLDREYPRWRERWVSLSNRISAAGSKPNILFAFADDWGRHASAYARIDGPGTVNDLLLTPHFDRVANEGVLFRSAFVSAPSCTPCRGALLSGQHFWRTGRSAILRGAVWDGSQPSFALLLHDAGYHLGKSYRVWSPGTPVDAPYGGQQHAYESAGRRINQCSPSM